MSFTTTLLHWFSQHARPLPWRATRDPYAIWLSEIILQQTRVSQGMAYWQRFLERWPTVEALAGATEDEVLRMWQGLGYYSRARHLHAAARQIVERGSFPDTFVEIRRLSGVGDYTAAAVASMAFGEPVAVVDGNVYRVLARHYGIDTPIDTSQGKRELAALAQELLPPDEPSAYNQALMDFGATQCVPLSPRCEECPLIETCVAYSENRVGKLPVKARATKVTERRLTYIYIRCNGYTALRRRSGGDIWQGLWEPLNASEGEPLTLEALAQTEGARLTLVAKNVRHQLTHRLLLADFYLLETPIRPALPSQYEWIEEADVDTHALPRLVELLLERL